MKKLLLLLFAFTPVFTTALLAQDANEVNLIWDAALASEKEALMNHTADYEIWRMTTNRTSTPQAAPYPQFKVLADSMKVHLDVIQSYRRKLAEKKTAFDKRIEGKKKWQKDSEAKSLFNDVIELAAKEGQEANKSAEASRTFHQQFENLKMLYKVRIIDYAIYLEEFLIQTEEVEGKVMQQGRSIGKLRSERKIALDKGDLEVASKLNGKISDLEAIHELSQAKLTQLHNFQDRLGSTTPDEPIYFGPGIEPPYELKTMFLEVEELNSQFEVFDLLLSE